MMEMLWREKLKVVMIMLVTLVIVMIVMIVMGERRR